jgi:gliding motility-associated-like protein
LAKKPVSKKEELPNKDNKFSKGRPQGVFFGVFLFVAGNAGMPSTYLIHYNMLKHLLAILTVVLFCTLSIKVRASEGFRGGKLEYRFKTTDSIEILLTVYTTCEAQSGGGVSSVYFGQQKLYINEGADTLIEYLPVCNYYTTPNICPDTISRCSLGGATKLFYTSMIFEYKKVLPISKFSNCVLTFFWQGEGTNGTNPGRNTANVTGHSTVIPYLYAFVDFCTIKNPNSPIFTTQFHDAILVGKDFFFNYGITVDEPLDDSVYFELITPLTTNGVVANYFSPRSKERPISFLGFPNDSLSTPAGFHVDNNCGYVYFRPIKQNEVTNFAVKVTRFVKRLGNTYKVSEVMYEHEVWVYSQNQFKYFFPIPKVLGPNTCIEKSLYPPIICNENKPRREPEKLICTNDSVLLTTYYDTSYRYQWNKNGNPISGATKYRYWATDSGLYTVDVLNNETGCFKTSVETKVTIFDGELPIISTDSVFRYCKGDTAFIKRENKHYDWLLWKVNGQAYSDDTAYVFKATQSATYTLDVVNKQGCRVSSAPLQITVSNPDTTGLFSEAMHSHCGDFTDTLRAIKPLNAYNWQKPTTSTDSFFVATQGGKYYLSGKDTNNCPIADSVMVYKHPVPVVNLGADTSVCHNAPINKNLWATDVYHPSYQYIWGNNPADTLHTYTVVDSGTYFVHLADSNNCTAADTITIKRFNKTLVSLGNDTGICHNVVLNHTLIATPTPVSNYKYQWNNNPADTLNTYTATNAGVYFINLTDSNQCPAGDSAVITRYAETKINLGADTAVCFTVPISRTLKATDSFIAGYKYLWNNNLADTLHSLPINTEGEYFVAVTDTNFCTTYDTITLLRYPKIGLSLGNDRRLCDVTADTIVAGSGFANYVWNTGATANFIAVNTGGDYWVAVTDSNNCSAADSITISFGQSPKITLDDSTLCDEEFITLQVPNLYDTYLWSNGSTDYITDIKDTGAIWVRVFNTCGEAKATAWVRGCHYDPPEIYIPNAFTPNNGDGFNNEFKVYAENIRTFNMKIFNRWGELIFQSDDVQQGWDGTFANKPVQQDIYVYVIAIMDKNRKLNTYFGNVTLIR